MFVFGNDGNNKMKNVFWYFYNDLFFGCAKFVVYYIPLLVLLSLLFVPDDYIGILPGNLKSQMNYGQYFTGKVTYVADMMGMLYTIIFLYCFIVYIVKNGLSNKTKQLIYQQIGGGALLLPHTTQRILGGVLFLGVCCIYFIIIFIYGNVPLDKDKEIYGLIHSSSVIYLAFLSFLNYCFMIPLIFIFLALDPYFMEIDK